MSAYAVCSFRGEEEEDVVALLTDTTIAGAGTTAMT